MNAAAPQQFTAARIAEVLGKAPRVVRRWLAGITPDGEMMVRGNFGFSMESGIAARARHYRIDGHCNCERLSLHRYFAFRPR